MINQSISFEVSQVEVSKRADFLAKESDGRFLEFEGLLFDLAAEHCRGYDGGYWEMNTVCNGSFFMSPTSQDYYNVTVADNWFDGQLSAEATGVFLTLLTYNRLAWKYRLDAFINRFYALREFALQHAEAALILKAID